VEFECSQGSGPRRRLSVFRVLATEQEALRRSTRLWADHLFEPLLRWVNEELVPARWLVLEGEPESLPTQPASRVEELLPHRWHPRIGSAKR
jgi:hypothetical protein